MPAASASSAARWTARHVTAAVVGGLTAGAAAGLGARLVMYGIRLANPSYNGAVTHAGVVNGRWTLSGTLTVVAQAAVVGIFGGVLYGLLRPLLRGGPALRGIEFGVLLFVAFGGLVLDGSYEFVRFVSTWIAVAAFAALYPLYGVVLGVVAGRIAPAPARHHWPRVSAVVSALLAVWVALQAVGYVGHLRYQYFS